MTHSDPAALLSDAFLARHPVEAAGVASRLMPEQILDLCQSAPSTVVAPVIALLDPVVASTLLADLPTSDGARIAGHMSVDVATVVLRRLPPARREVILAAMPSSHAALLRGCLSYPEGRAGSLLDPTVLTVQSDLTVKDALDSVARSGPHAHYYVFVVDRFLVLVGVVSLRELFTALPHERIGAIARPDVARIGADADRTEILAHPAWNDLHALPVVDAEGRFLGILRHEMLRRLETGEATASAGQAALDFSLDLGELCWAGGNAVVNELWAVLQPAVGVTRSKP